MTNCKTLSLRTVIAFVASAILMLSTVEIPAVERPNFVLFLADDCTYRDIGCYGSDDSITPAIDQLAQQGMRFTNCYQASAMCSPTRHNLYTGLYPVRTGAYPNHTFVDPWVKSMLHYLKNLGYRVGFIGKRHIGPRDNFPFEYLGDKPKGSDHIDLAVSEAFLKEVALSKEPFCLIVCSHQPHGPYTVGDRSLFDAKSLRLRNNTVDTPETRENFVGYLAEINFMDGQVKTLLRQLKQNSLDQNSLVVYLSEQGSSFPFSKWTCYDDGVKSAFIARWPGVIKPGSVTDALVEYNDILPTFIAAAGGKIPDQLDGVNLTPVFNDPSLKGKRYAFSMQTTRGIIKGSDYFGIRSVTDGRYRYIYNLSPEVQFSNGFTVARNPKHWWGSWLQKAKTDPNAAKLVNQFLNRPPIELYDSESDPDNLRNLATDPRYKKRCQEMHQAVLDWMRECGDKGLKTELFAFQRMRQHRQKVTPEIGEFTAVSTPSGELIETKYVPGTSLKAFIEIPVDGYYTFYKSRKKNLTTSIVIDGKTILDESRKSGYGIAALKKGLHEFEIIKDSSGNEEAGDIGWSGPNRLRKPLETAVYRKLN